MMIRKLLLPVCFAALLTQGCMRTDITNKKTAKSTKTTTTTTTPSDDPTTTTTEPTTSTDPVTVGNPTVSITSPINAATVTANASLVINASAQIPSGGASITKVEFYHDGTQLIATSTTAPYTATYANVPAGTHSITAKLTNAEGYTTESSVTVTAVVRTLSATITAPANNASVPMDTDLLITVDPGDPSNVSKVEFYRDGYNWFGATSASPYQATYSLIPSGTHTITVRVTPISGSAILSTITVNASLAPLLPDLVVTSIVYSNGIFKATVKNQGTKALSSGNVLSATFSVDGTATTTASSTLTSALNIGDSTTLQSAKISSLIAYGRHTFSATVNPSSTLKETNYTNNAISTVMDIFAQPDLYVESTSYSEGVFKAVIVNRGDVATTAGLEFRVGFYIDGVIRNYATTTASIAMGAKTTLTSAGTDTLAAGSYTLMAYVDDLTNVSESDKTNNKLTVSVAPPSAPINIRAFSADKVASVSFSAPNTTNKAPTLSYKVTSNRGDTMTGTSSPIIFTNLTNGANYTFTVTAINSLGSAASIASNSVTPAVVSTLALSRATRPAYNSGAGFFVLNGKLYDPNGVEFNVRGVNICHWDSVLSGVPASGSNTERWAIDFTKPATTNVAIIQKGAINNHLVPIVGNWKGTCSDSAAVLESIVDTWVEQASAWKTLDSYMILNIANEWGPSNSTVWRDSYITAIQRLRAAGYTSTISITSGGCGQDVNNITKYAQAVFDSDPQKNIVFDYHAYGGTTSANIATNFAAMKNTGLPIMIGEFGPGRNIGPSPTLVTPGEVMTEADKNGFGMLAWAWDDHDGSNDDYWFQMSFQVNYNFVYTKSSDLSIFGRDVVENPVYGTKVKGVLQTAY
jgi:mannan endo-1,4-beta-mannosidase